MKAFIIRHAEAEGQKRYLGRRCDPSLSRLGRKQAQALSQRMADKPLSTIYSSPLRRAFETAELIAAPHKLTIETIRELEEIDFGLWDGLRFDEINSKYPDLYHRWLTDTLSTTPPEGEALSDFGRRVCIAFDSIASQHFKKTIAIITHGGPARVILCRALGLKLEAFQSLRMDIAAVSLLGGNDPNRYVLNLHNDTCHLGPESK